MAQRGARDVEPERPLEGEVVDLDHHAVDLVVEVVAVLLPPGAEGEHLVEAVDQVDLGIDREPGAAEPGRGCPTGWWPGRRSGRPVGRWARGAISPTW